MANRSIRQLGQSPLFSMASNRIKKLLDDRHNREQEAALALLGTNQSEVVPFRIKLKSGRTKPVLVSRECHEMLQRQQAATEQLITVSWNRVRIPLRAVLRSRSSRWA